MTATEESWVTVDTESHRHIDPQTQDLITLDDCDHTRGHVEIARLLHEPEIENEGDRVVRMPGEAFVLIGEQRKSPEYQRRNQYRNQSGEQAPDAPRVEGTETETPVSLLAEQDQGDQVPGNDKKDVDAQESAGQYRRGNMEGENAEDGNCP